MRSPYLILALTLQLFLTTRAFAGPALPLGSTELNPGPDFFAGNKTVVYLEDLETGQSFTINGAQVDKRHPPFSSFKIPNFLIALETEVVTGPEELLPYDAQRRPRQDYWPEDWAQDQTLTSAFQRSAAWAFQDLALRVGEQAYQGYLEHFRYGNEQCRGDAFWLDGSLEISAREQVEFLRMLLTQQLEISPLHLQALKDAAEQKTTKEYALYAKTGSGSMNPPAVSGPFQGWYVGWLERRQKKPVVFALYTQGPSFDAIRDYRRAATLSALRLSGLLPESW